MSSAQLKIEYWPIDRPQPALNNARTHLREQHRLLVRSIKRFGMATAIGVGADERVVYGHARLEAAREAGLT